MQAESITLPQESKNSLQRQWTAWLAPVACGLPRGMQVCAEVSWWPLVQGQAQLAFRITSTGKWSLTAKACT